MNAGVPRLRRLVAALRQPPRRRVPVVLQMTPTECGAACLAMIVSFHGRKTPLSEARVALDPGRDGTSARALASVARSYGLDVRAYAADVGNLPAVPTPAVLHWGFSHFVVLERWSNGKATIVDPARGRVDVDPSELDEAFTGVVLTFAPGNGLRRGRAPRQPRWGIYLREIRNLRKELAVVVAASLLIQLAGLAIPVLTAFVVDRVIPARDETLLPLLAGVAGLLVANHLLVSSLRERLLVFVRARLDLAFTTRFFEHLLSLPLGFFERRATGDLLARLSGNAAIREALSGQAVAAMLDGGLVIGYALILFTQDVGFALLALALTGLEAAFFVTTTRRMHLLLQRELAARADAQTSAVQALTGIGTLKASGSERRAYDVWSGLFAHEVAQTVATGRTQARVTAVSTALRLLLPLSLLLFGAHRVSSGEMSLGVMFALVALATAFAAPLVSLVATAVQVQRASAYLDRLVDVLAATPEAQILRGRRKRRLSGAIEVRDVGFKYDATAPYVLRDVSLVIRAGETIGIAGRTGSGKTTLAKLLLGLYVPTEGDVLYDGASLHEYDVTALREQFGVVLQEPALFGGTIRDNIAFHDPGLSLDRVIEAAKAAALHDDIAAMPLGYATPVGEGGSGLSGGQRQRLALARAVAADPAVLLLDEATSHLDAVTEETIAANLGRLVCTRVVIAHRLSTIRRADRIVVVEGGRIVEEGTHADLVARNGHYAALVGRQFDPRTDATLV